MAKRKQQLKERIFDFSLSFAGEDRAVAAKLHHLLERSGARVFYDDKFRPFLLGKKMTKEFKKIYGASTRFVVPIISKHYPEKDWTDFEFSIGKRERGRRREEFILPLRLDKTKILGLHDDVGYIDLQQTSIKEAAEVLLSKIGLELTMQPEWWAVGYVVNLPEYIEKSKHELVDKDDMDAVDELKEQALAHLRAYLNSTGAECRIWRDYADEYRNLEQNDSFGVWVLLHWDPATSPFPLESTEYWELSEMDTYQSVFLKDEPDDDEGE